MIDHKSMGYAMMIIVICSIIALPVNLMDQGADVSVVAMIAAAIFTPLLSIGGTFFSTLIAWGVGKIFKGVATYTEMFRALSVTYIPSALLGPLYLIWYVVSPESLVTPDFTGPIPAIFWITILLTIAIGIWSFVLSVAAVAEAHQFSNWKAFFTLIIPTIIIFIIVFALLSVLIFALLGLN